MPRVLAVHDTSCDVEIKRIWRRTSRSRDLPRSVPAPRTPLWRRLSKARSNQRIKQKRTTDCVLPRPHLPSNSHSHSKGRKMTTFGLLRLMIEIIRCETFISIVLCIRLENNPPLRRHLYPPPHRRIRNQCMI